MKSPNPLITLLQALNKAVVQQHYKPCEPLLKSWASTTEQAHEAARSELSRHWSVRHERRVFWLWALGCAALAGGAVPFFFSMTERGVGLVVALNALMAFLLSSILWHFIGVREAVQGGRKELLELLEPANQQPFLCKDAADRVEKYAKAREYRNSVVEQGQRGLVVADFNCISALAYMEEAERRKSADHQNCMRLHGLASEASPSGVQS